jgi:hypothetical protein
MSNRNGASEAEFSAMDSSAHEDNGLLEEQGDMNDPPRQQQMTISSDEVNYLIHR